MPKSSFLFCLLDLSIICQHVHVAEWTMDRSEKTILAFGRFFVRLCRFRNKFIFKNNFTYDMLEMKSLSVLVGAETRLPPFI